MIRVLIVDDHPIVRKGLRSELSGVADMEVVGEAASGADALAVARSVTPDVILLDISMPGMSGFDVLRQLHEEQHAAGILMLSTYPEKQYAIRCYRNGALGYLTKESTSDELVAAIRKVCTGGRYVSPSMAEMLASAIDEQRDILPHERLSDREYQILCLLGRGNTVTEVGELLSLSPSTVNTHRAHILEKMHLTTTAQLIHYVLEHRLSDRTE